MACLVLNMGFNKERPSHFPESTMTDGSETTEN